MMNATWSPPLGGVRVVELAGLAPGVPPNLLGKPNHTSNPPGQVRLLPFYSLIMGLPSYESIDPIPMRTRPTLLRRRQTS